MYILRRRGSTKVGGALTCPRCGSAKVKFVETQGFDLDVYKCRVCNTPIRYMTTPLDQHAIADIQHGMKPGPVHRSGNIVSIPGIGEFKVGKPRT